MRKLSVVFLVVVLAGVVFFATSGRFLIVDHPERADVIVVLAGETDRRPARGLQLLADGYAPKMLLDVPSAAKVYDATVLQLAQSYLQGLPQKGAVAICPVIGLSTKTESHDVARCLKSTGTHRILLVTSDYHTRRARSTFAHELPAYQFSVAAAYDPQQFGGSWWEHRQWAKLNYDEWIRLVWWELIDRWR